nr:MAG TPA: hypothetical protein [Caudoviricetes sp.]
MLRAYKLIKVCYQHTNTGLAFKASSFCVY